MPLFLGFRLVFRLAREWTGPHRESYQTGFPFGSRMQIPTLDF